MYHVLLLFATPSFEQISMYTVPAFSKLTDIDFNFEN